MTDIAPGGRRVIAIDGPAASGKSTTAAAVARQLGFVHLNSGLLYRALTWWTIRNGWKETDPGFARRIERLRIELRVEEGELRVLVEGHEPGEALHGPNVTNLVSAVAGLAAVRRATLTLLRDAGARFDLVCDGRDIGTTVFPRAHLKVFLVADATERARRRLLERGVEADAEAIEREVSRLIARDRADRSRALSPLRRASDAIEIDTTRQHPEAVVDQIVALALERHPDDPSPGAATS